MAEVSGNDQYPLIVEEAFERVGRPIEVFVGSASTAAVAIFLGALGILVGVGGTAFFTYDIIIRGFDERVFRAIPIPFFAWLGWIGIRTGIRNRFVRLYICEKGLVHQMPRSVAIYPWEDIEEVIQDWVKYGSDENGMPFMNRSTTFAIKRKDGAQLEVSTSLLKKPLTFMRRIYPIVKDRGIPWTVADHE
jgi:hypothetical protein